MESTEKRLGVVMSTDIKGYTALVQSDESKAMELVDTYQETVSRLTKKYQGELISFYGDGALTMFGSPVVAVQCALELQNEFKIKEVPVRAGLHMGEVTIRDGNVLGETLKTAAAVEGAGVPGAIVMSDKVQSEFFNHPEIQTQSIGQFRFGNTSLELYAVTNDGLPIPPPQAKAKTSRSRITQLTILSIFLIALAYLIYDLLKGSDQNVNDELKQQRIAVRVQDFAKLSTQDDLANMSAHWISSRIEEIPGSSVVGYNEAMEQPELQLATADARSRKQFSVKTGASNILEGQIFPSAKGDSIVFEARIFDLDAGTQLHSFKPVECSSNNPMICIEEISNEILGWWASKDMRVTSVPSYRSYEAYLGARRIWLDDPELARIKLRESIEFDQSFVDPYFMLISNYANDWEFEKRDSVIDVISGRFDELSPRQTYLLNAFEAQSVGDLPGAYTAYLHEVATDSQELFVNTEGMLYAIEYVNRPKEALRLFEQIPIDSLDLDECEYCAERLRLAIRANVLLGNYQQAAQIGQRISDTRGRLPFLALAALKDTAEIDRVVQRALARNTHESGRMYGYAAWSFVLFGEERLAQKYAEKGFDIFPEKYENAGAVEAAHVLQRYDEAADYLLDWMQKVPNNDFLLYYAARTIPRSSNAEAMRVFLSQLETVESNKYHYGQYTYLHALIEMGLGNNDKALDYLQQAYAQGKPFLASTYMLDIDLMPLFDDPRFQDIIQPKIDQSN